MKDPASFRDPSGFVFRKDGLAYRQINLIFKDDFDLFISSGLYRELSGDGFLVAHEEADIRLSPEPDRAYKVILPRQIPFISYPYEWSFLQLKDAALLTLAAQKAALARGMCLKDASAYNVQFIGDKPVLIDTLSFERYMEGTPWVAYGQFCRHFLAPLCLMGSRDTRLVQLLRSNVDGIPLDLAAGLLPFWTKLNPGLLAHIHLHAKTQSMYGGREIAGGTKQPSVSKFGLLGIIDSLESCVRSLRPPKVASEWGDYYSDTSYTREGLAAKAEITARFLKGIAGKGGIVWDLGANDGRFSKLACAEGAYTVAFDMDPVAVGNNYTGVSRTCGGLMLPLVMDLANPSPASGFACAERMSLIDRAPAGVVMALALVHHLAISNNVPFTRLAGFFADCGRDLIIEFVPKQDPQVKRLLVTRRDIFDGYTRENFESAFNARFDIAGREDVPGTGRCIYLMKGKGK